MAQKRTSNQKTIARPERVVDIMQPTQRSRGAETPFAVWALDCATGLWGYESSHDNEPLASVAADRLTSEGYIVCISEFIPPVVE